MERILAMVTAASLVAGIGHAEPVPSKERDYDL
jgi:hypothetical protein